MPTPLHRLRKDELVWLASHRCKHRHTYIEHYQCYVDDHPDHERLGFFDIEASNLQADFGILLSWSIKLAGDDDIRHDVLHGEDIRHAAQGQEDYRIVESCVAALEELDTVVTHYGNSYRYDVPFLRTRAVAMRIPFPHYGTLKQLDTYPILKSKFRLSRNRQETAVRELVGETEKNHVVGWRWRAAVRGDEESLAYVLDHNLRDVRDLEKLWNAIKDYSPERAVSI